MSFLSSSLSLSRSKDAYHQTILQLAESSATPISWQVTQHVLDRLWVAPFSAGTSTPSSVPFSAAVTTTAAVGADDDKKFLYGCQRCGYILHPGWRGTNLRVKRSRKKSSPSGNRNTVRRRQQRKRKRQARAAEKRSVDDGNRRRRTSASQSNNKDGSSIPYTSRNNHTATPYCQRLILLKNDPSFTRNNCNRNHFVLTCGRCCDRVHLRGMPKATTTISSVTTITNNKKKTGILNTANSFAAITTKADESLIDNYEPLLPSTTTKNLSSSGSSRHRSLLEQKRDAKFGLKKMKKSGGISSNKKAGNIMDFLSSLNNT